MSTHKYDQSLLAVCLQSTDCPKEQQKLWPVFAVLIKSTYYVSGQPKIIKMHWWTGWSEYLLFGHEITHLFLSYDTAQILFTAKFSTLHYFISSFHFILLDWLSVRKVLWSPKIYWMYHSKLFYIVQHIVLRLSGDHWQIHLWNTTRSFPTCICTLGICSIRINNDWTKHSWMPVHILIRVSICIYKTWQGNLMRAVTVPLHNIWHRLVWSFDFHECQLLGFPCGSSHMFRSTIIFTIYFQSNTTDRSESTCIKTTYKCNQMLKLPFAFSSFQVFVKNYFGNTALLLSVSYHRAGWWIAWIPTSRIK